MSLWRGFTHPYDEHFKNNLFYHVVAIYENSSSSGSVHSHTLIGIIAPLPVETLRRHQVTLKSTVSTIVVTTLVLEGWSSKLDPDLHILDTMREMLSGDDAILERLGRVVDRICHAPAPSSLFT